MTHWLLKPWRIASLVAGLLAPAIVVLVAGVWYAPSVLRWDPPNPGAIAARYRDAMNDADAGDLEAALDKLEALRSADAFNGLVHAAIADVQHRANRLPEAIAAAQAAVAADPMLGEAWYNLGCYLIEAGRDEAALVALHEAVDAGFDARAVGKRDPDLEPIAKDPRWTVYLEGSEALPLAFRTASFEVSPVTILEGEPFTVTLTVYALNRAAGSPPPPVSVEYVGADQDRSLVPLEVFHRLQVVDKHHARHFVWTFRYRLRSRQAMHRKLGPWEVQLEGVRLAVSSPVLAIQPIGSRDEIPSRAEAGTQPKFRPRAFFRAPIVAAWRPGTSLVVLPSDQVAWEGGVGLAASVCGSSVDPSSPPTITWADEAPVRAQYDIRVEDAGHVRCAARVFVVQQDTVARGKARGIRVSVDGAVFSLNPVPLESAGE